MTREKSIVGVPAEDTGIDRRVRCVLRGGTDEVANAVPADPMPEIDIEETLRDGAEPRRIRVRRQSGL
jgi:hypothetical protein